MAKYDLQKIRNIGIIAHIDAGKTTSTEHILYYSGAKHRLGEVDAGTTETDYNVEEQDRGITIYSACIPFSWQDCTINLIDTPGHVDFTAEVERSLRVLDGCVVVFDAQKGVEAQSETVWRQADSYGVPRLVFINKMDVVGADFPSALEEIRERLEGRPVALTIPIGSGSPKDSPTPFAGIIDLIEMVGALFRNGRRRQNHPRRGHSRRAASRGPPLARALIRCPHGKRRARPADQRTPGRPRDPRGLDPRGPARADVAAPDPAGAVRLGAGTHRHPAFDGCRLLVFAQSARSAARARHEPPQKGQGRKAPARPERAILWAGFQDRR